MIVEVLAVGTELLLGQIVNGNAAKIGTALADHGFDAHFQVVVGDNLDRVAAAVKTAIGRADAMIITGGIGPTQDDLTREAVCAAFGLEMRFSDSYAESLKERFLLWGREMPASNLRQAEYPEGAVLLPNPKGTAPGLVLEHEEKLIFLLPGVPVEMSYLLEAEVMPRLGQAAGVDAVVFSRILRSWGRTESQIGEMLEDLFRATTNPSIAFLASAGEIKVRITAKARTIAEAEKLVAPVEAEVRARLHPSVFATDNETIERVIQTQLMSRSWTIGTAESATGGLVAARLTATPGASAFYRGSLVTYAPDLKTSLLGVDDLSAGLVSEPTALAMAHGARRALQVDVAVSVVGSAGPEPLEQPVGTVVMAVATPEAARARIVKFPGDRERIRVYSATTALHLVRLAVTGEWWSS
jgi:nicotinamide-nucleotide amidase